MKDDPLASDAAFTGHGFLWVPRITQPPNYRSVRYPFWTLSGRRGGLRDALGPENISLPSKRFEPVTIGTPVERAATRPPQPHYVSVVAAVSDYMCCASMIAWVSLEIGWDSITLLSFMLCRCFFVFFNKRVGFRRDFISVGGSGQHYELPMMLSRIPH